MDVVECREWLSVLAPWVAIGLATLELKKWRKQQAATTRAEVAAEAVVAVLEITDAMVRAAKAVRRTEDSTDSQSGPATGPDCDGDEQEAQRQRALQDFGKWYFSLVDNPELVGRFHYAWRRVEGFLDEDTGKAMEELNKTRAHMSTSMERHLEGAGDLSGNATGDAVISKINDLKDKAVAALRAHALYRVLPRSV